ncbi:unnamed protein product [Paramecium sonneborni]|uniref:Uncharacterized protein n=1 Tax=Paramecium sonneborni TaxID=65129 RepID=A0A8S1RP56_9CILI|nr:unnamed protein product [Paramecium sonneborni]
MVDNIKIVRIAIGQQFLMEDQVTKLKNSQEICNKNRRANQHGEEMKEISEKKYQRKVNFEKVQNKKTTGLGRIGKRKGDKD